MRLGDVLEQTEPEDQAPPRRRRVGLWIALWLLLGLGALSWAHGPIVLFPQADEALVVYSSVGILGPPERVVGDAPFVIRLPLVQQAVRIDTAPREANADVDLAVKGIAVRLVGGRITHRVWPAEAAQVIERLGVEPGPRDALVADIARTRWIAALGALELDQLGDPAKVTAALDAASKGIADDVAEFGIEAEVSRRPAIEVDPELAERVFDLARLGTAGVSHAAGAERDRSARRAMALARGRNRQGQQAEAMGDLAARLARAEQAASEARIDAERAHADRIARAKLEQATLTAVARTIEAEARVDTARVRAVVDAIGDNGSRLLDHAITTHVLPQLARVRTGAPAPGPFISTAPDAPIPVDAVAPEAPEETPEVAPTTGEPAPAPASAAEPTTADAAAPDVPVAAPPATPTPEAAP